MKISTRFTEFGMTGAFFWITQILFFCIAYEQDPFTWLPGWIFSQKINQSDILKDSLGSLLTVCGVIGIFITGLILDLLGSYFALSEMSLFNRHLKRNKGWLDELSGQCAESIKADYEMFRDHVGTSFVTSFKTAGQRIRLLGKCHRLQTYLSSYIHVFSSPSEMLVDHIHLWRTSRAISTTLLILAIEVLALKDHALASYGIMLVLYAILFAGSILITLKSYSRMCYTLFGLACATYSKQLATRSIR